MNLESLPLAAGDPNFVMEIFLTLALLLLGFPFQSSSVSHCTFYEDPKNGYVTCDSLFHLFCSPECHPGYRFAAKPAVVYMCGPVTGEWFTYPAGSGLPWPDCVPDDRSERSIQEELLRKRNEITRHISEAQTGIPTPYYGQLKTQDPEERYHHLYDYIEKAQKAYEYRDAIELETEKLKQENSDVNGNVYETNNQFYEDPSLSYGRQYPMFTSKLAPGKVPNKGVAKVLNNTLTFSDAFHHPPSGNGKEPRVAQIIGRKYGKYSSGNTNPSGPTDKLFQTSSSNRDEGEKANASAIRFSSNLQSPEYAGVSTIPKTSNISSVEKHSSPLKQDSDFVLRMLNNQEVKDLHHLDEHVRLHRDAQLSLMNAIKTTSSSVTTNQNDFGEPRKINLQRELYSKENITHDSARDKLANTSIKAKENEELSGHIVPIVIPGASIINSLASLLQKQNRNAANKPLSEKTLQRNIMKQEGNQTKTEGNSYGNQKIVKPLSIVKKMYESHNDSQLQRNQKHESIPLGSILGPPNKNTSAGMRDIYKGWLTKHQNWNKNVSRISQNLLDQLGGNAYSAEQNASNIGKNKNVIKLQITKNTKKPQDINRELYNYANVSTNDHGQELKKMLPRQEESASSVQNVNNPMSLNKKQATNAFQVGFHGEKETVNHEHLFYFPIKKDTLFKLFNGTLPKP